MDIIRIAIVGGGIGGMAAALALQRSGQHVVVYERSPQFREIGAGLIITANARRALQALGVDEALAAISSCEPLHHTCNYATGEVLRTLSNESLRERFGLHTLGVHRADLHSVMRDAVQRNDPTCLRPGHAFVRLDQDPAGVTLAFENGATDRVDVVIGADGNASAVRSFLFPGEAPRFNGQVAYRALVPMDRVPAKLRELGMAMNPSPRRYLLHYPLRGGQIMNVIGCGQSEGWEEEGWSIPAENEAFATAYADFAPIIVELIRAIPPGALFKWGLRDREPLADWVTGRVAMLGDAAHPMTPFLGQGACLALEDAVLLGRAFAVAEHPEQALQRYEAARKTRGNGVQLASREEGRALQDPSIARRSAVDRGLLEYDPATTPV